MSNPRHTIHRPLHTVQRRTQNTGRQTPNINRQAPGPRGQMHNARRPVDIAALLRTLNSCQQQLARTRADLIRANDENKDLREQVDELQVDEWVHEECCDDFIEESMEQDQRIEDIEMASRAAIELLTRALEGGRRQDGDEEMRNAE